MQGAPECTLMVRASAWCDVEAVMHSRTPLTSEAIAPSERRECDRCMRAPLYIYGQCAPPCF